MSYELRGVEIFKAGTWNGQKYTTADLDAMVAAANEVGFTPPVKLGHTSEPGMPAMGWVENLRRVGAMLLADIVSLPQAVFELIKERRYERVSAEIYWDLERGGKKFSRVLRALALLGADIPAVNLRPLRDFLPKMPEGQFSTYAVDIQLPTEANMVELTTPAEISSEVARRTHIRIAQEKLDPRKDYSKALTEVLDADPKLKAGYALGDVVEGPRNKVTLIPDPDFAPVQERYVRKYGDWPVFADAITAAQTNRELVNAIAEACFAATGDRGYFHRELLRGDPQLAGLYTRS